MATTGITHRISSFFHPLKGNATLKNISPKIDIYDK